MKKHTIIGMAGHIDHGKTALIRALTGIETDQLKEEKERGITIDIGFAYWQENVTIIDVPGHEKFIRNMVAGVSTVDLFLLVIAADDGIMPQTREHLDILKFFGVRDGIVALNKTDLVDEEWFMLVQDEIESFLRENGYSNVSILPVSAEKSQGIDELRQALTSKIEQVEESVTTRPFRLNVDRSFSAKGFGSIITGTVLSSHITPGITLKALPLQKEGKIRGLQVHQRDAVEAVAGQRVAINLANLTKEDLVRGAVLVCPDSLETTREIFAKVITTGDIKFKIKRHQEVRIHIGTAEYTAKIDWFEHDSQLQSNKKYHSRIRFEDECVCAPGDAILVRTLSPVISMAGGKVLQINPPRIRRDDSDWQNYFETLASEDLQKIIRLEFDYHGFATLNSKQLQKRLFESATKIDSILTQMVKSKLLLEFEYGNEQHFIMISKRDEAADIIKPVLEEKLGTDQYQRGLNFKELHNAVKKWKMSTGFLERTLKFAVNSKKIFMSGEYYAHQDMTAMDNRNKLQLDVETAYRSGNFAPPDFNNLAQQLGIQLKEIKAITQDLVKSGKLQSVGGQYYLHKETWDALLSFLRSHFDKQDELNVTMIKDFVNSTRKYVIPLLEFLDNKGYTTRQGDYRIRGTQL